MFHWRLEEDQKKKIKSGFVLQKSIWLIHTIQRLKYKSNNFVCGEKKKIKKKEI